MRLTHAITQKRFRFVYLVSATVALLIASAAEQAPVKESVRAVGGGKIDEATGKDEKGAAGSGRVTTPFQLLESRHIAIMAKVNGKGPYRMIFDLGAPVTLLSNKAGEESGVVPAGTPKSFVFGTRGEFTAKTFEIGDLKAKDAPVVVLDHPLIGAMNRLFHIKLEGIIGYTFFARYKVTIDYQAKTLTFEPVDFQVRNFMKELPDRLAGPKVARERYLSAPALWGLTVDEAGEGERIAAAGVKVVHVLADSAAAHGGIEPGDMITSIDGRWTTSVLDAHAAAATVAAGRSVAVGVIRGGKALMIAIEPADGV